MAAAPLSQLVVSTVEFARRLATKYHHHFAAHLLCNHRVLRSECTGSAVEALSRDEILVRWALTQQALNERTRIANHTRAPSGRRAVDRHRPKWRAELTGIRTW